MSYVFKWVNHLKVPLLLQNEQQPLNTALSCAFLVGEMVFITSFWLRLKSEVETVYICEPLPQLLCLTPDQFIDFYKPDCCTKAIDHDRLLDIERSGKKILFISYCL